MFYHIKGEFILSETLGTSHAVVIECGGIGYRLTVSSHTLEQITAQKEKIVKVLTHLNVREDSLELFGFFDQQELSAFRMLITVSGIGPKAAMSLLSLLSPEKFALAVASGDTKALSKAPGVGLKTSARIILELKDKVAKELSMDTTDTGADEWTAVAASHNKLSEAQNALLVLGYTRTEVSSVLRTIDTSSMELEEIIRIALKKMMK